MRIQTEYMSFKYCSTISSSYDFQPHQLCFQTKCCFSQSVLERFKVLPGLPSPLADLSSVLPDMLSALRIMLSVFPNMSSVLPGVARIVVSTPRSGKELREFSQVHRGVFNCIPITPSALLYQATVIPVTLKVSRNSLRWSVSLQNIAHLSLHSTYPLKVLEASSD
jgi:hypothetical protein